MKEIKAYKTSDGVVFEDQRDADTHQARLDLQEVLDDLISGVFCYGTTHDELVRDLLEKIDRDNSAGEDLSKKLRAYLKKIK